MNAKKKILLISGMLLTIIIVVTIIILINNKDTNIYNNNVSNNTNNGFLTLMLEQDDGSYKESTSNTWPESGYIYNSNLSKCENGSTLIYNEETNTVNLKASVSDRCYVYFDKYINPVVNSVSATSVSNDSITVSVSATSGTSSISRYYYSSNNGSSYSNSTSNTYTFSGLSSGTTYQIKVYVVDSNGEKSNEYSISVETDDTMLLADYIKGLYTSQGANGLYYHTSSLANSAADNSYRYAGSNPNNYVCFGSDAATCPSANLYRIIGVFGDEVKLIKSTSYGVYRWNSGTSNTWDSSTKPDIRSTLNTTYFNTLDEVWQTKIATHAFKVGGMRQQNGFESNAKTAYNYEVGSNSSITTDSMKIGLMYLSDYYYGASPTYWTYPGYDSSGNDYRAATGSNWTHLGSYEWTISRSSGFLNYAFRVNSKGYVHNSVVTGSYAVRPVFYLTSSTNYVSGSGSSTDPIRIQ